jgi:hypothetical protein
MGAVKEDSGEVPCNCSYGTVAYQGGFYAAGAVDPAEGRRIAAQGRIHSSAPASKSRHSSHAVTAVPMNSKRLLNRLSPRSGVQCGIIMRRPQPPRLYPVIPQGQPSDMQSRVSCRMVTRFIDRPMWAALRNRAQSRRSWSSSLDKVMDCALWRFCLTRLRSRLRK